MSGVEGRRQAVMARLDRVTDPELDEPVTALGFIDSVDVDADRVHVRFRLPTYWCAANFAFLMADDMRRAVGSLDWVREVRVELGEHMEAERLNAGMRRGLSFRESFGASADAELDALRATFAAKSFQRRQEQLLRRLLDEGYTAEAVVGMTVGELRALATPPPDPLPQGEGVSPTSSPSPCGRGQGRGATALLVECYLERRGVPGAFAEDSPAFVDTNGRALTAASLGTYLRALRNVTVNMEFNGALCRGLLAARFDEEQPTDTGPGLRDFLRAAARQPG
ncbi:MAG: iron-sulfur cluster assembly protein [Acetobacteraceae bacterium]|nr:iron-sulfur cluster assembly protein [Acetobacteraceae bacterium]